MTSDQLESLLRELAVARRSADELKQELKTIHESHAWRFMDRVARFGLGRFFPARSEELPKAHLLDGKLVRCLNPMYLGRYFYCRDGKRHWVRSKAHLTNFDSRLGLRDVARISDEDMQQYQLAGPLPLTWSEDARAKPARKSMAVLREIAVSRLRGSGIEFGAGTDPVSVPLCCNVKYADLFTDGDLRSQVFSADREPTTFLSATK